jgi:Intracellular proteinase inhibitor
MRVRTRIIARLALVVGVGLVTAGYSKCVFVSNTGGTTVGVVGGDGSGSIVGTFSTTLELRDSAGVATTSFVFGEQIRFDLEVRNQSAQVVTLNFPDAQIYDFVVLDSDSARVRWRWSDNMSFPQVATQLRFEPNSSKAYSVLWDGVLSDGTQLPPGDYRARGVLVFNEFASDPIAADDLGSPLVNFTVQ